MIAPTTVRDRARERQLTAGNVFSVAIANLRKLGWVKSDYHAGQPGVTQVCLMGAVENAIGKLLNFQFDSHDDMENSTAIVSEYLAKTYPETFAGFTPELWNDTRASDVNQVITALETIAAKEASTPFDHLFTDQMITKYTPDPDAIYEE